jgi:hypothetical protein
MQRVCRVCSETKPIVQFTLRNRGERTNTCRKCKKQGRKRGILPAQPTNVVQTKGVDCRTFAEVYAGKDADHRICRKCGVEKTLGEFRRHRPGYPLSYTCIECWDNTKDGKCRRCGGFLVDGKCQRCKEADKRKHQKIRVAVLRFFGNKCACCGISESIFLTLDHVNNDGNEHRRKVGQNRIYRLAYYDIMKGTQPVGLQLLCWNCNSAKHIYGEEAVKEAIARMQAKSSN